MTNKKEYKILRKALSLTLAILVSILGIPLTEPQQASATEASGAKYLSNMTITATASTTWADKGKYNSTFYNTIIKNYNTYTADSPLEIDSADKLAAFAKVVNDTTDEAKDKDFSGKYVKLTKDINLGGTKPTITKTPSGNNFSISITGSASNVWVPIGGTEDNPFKGTFDGNGCEVRNMTVLVNNTSDRVYAGLFGHATGGSIKDTGVTGGDVYAFSPSYYSISAGGLVGYSYSSVTNSYATGNVYARSSSSVVDAGGLVGNSNSSGGNGSISNSYATGNVYASSTTVYAGGLVGRVMGSSYRSISNSYATGDVSASSTSSYYVYAGGLVGSIYYSNIINSYATGDVSASSTSAIVYAGGLLGEDSGAGGSVRNSYATGDVYASSTSSSGDCYAGGLAGHSSGEISNSYATGNVCSYSSTSTKVYAGGLVGGYISSSNYSILSNSYATGNVSASSTSASAGGLLGMNDGDGGITNCYYYSGSTIDAPSEATISEDGTGLNLEKITGIGEGRSKDVMGLSEDNWAFQEDSDLIRFLPRVNGITYNEETNPVPRLVGFISSNFNFKAPDNLTYDGSAKEAKVTSKISGITDDKITIKYYKDGSETSPIDMGTYIVKIDVAAGDNYEAQENITADNWTFTIEKAAPTIKSTSTSVEYKHGLMLKDVPFPSTDGNIPNGKWAWSDSDTTVIQYAGDHYYPAIFTPVESASDNYATASRLIFVQVGKGELSTDNFTFTPPKNNIYNGFGIYPTVKPNGLTGVGDITLKYYKLQVSEDGELIVLDPTSEPPTDVGTYGVSIDVTEDVNYKSAENLHPDWGTEFNSETPLEKLPWTFSILPIEPKDPGIPKANPIVYGNALGTSVLSVTGWKWVKPDEVPTVANNGYDAYYSIEGTVGKYDWTKVIEKGGYTFKPAEGLLPDRLEKTIEITVIPAVPEYKRPENLTATYGQTLANVKGLTRGWSWPNPEQSVGDVGTHQFEATFTQFKKGTTEADGNFETVTDTLNVKVTKADPKCILPENLTATYGDTLGSVLLPKQSESETPGTWKWANESQLVGDVTEEGNTFAAIFTPDDSDNYYTRTENLTVTVKKADLEASDFDFKASNAVYDGNEKTATVTLKSGIVGAGEITSVKYYKDEVETSPIGVGTYKVKINVSGGNNYNGVDGLSSTDWTFTITQAPATNPTTPTATTITYGDKVSDSKLSVDGWKWNEPDKVPNAGTDYYMAYYDVKDDTNYNWLGVDDYVPSKHRVERNIRLTVDPADPAIPETLSGTFGQTLGEIKISDVAGGTWSWKDENTRLSETGEKLFPATFTPKSSNYAEKETNLKVNVNSRPINSKEITISGVKDEYEYDGNTSSIQPEVTVIDKLIDSKNPLIKDTDYTVSYRSFSWKEDGGAIDGGVTIKGIGKYTGEVYIEFKIKDKVLPNGKIILDDNIEFSLFNSKVDFKYMFKEPKTVKIEGSDSETGIKSIHYYISKEDLFTSDGEYTNDEIEKIIPSEAWKLYNKGTPIELGKGSKNIIYAKIEDNSGNKKYISSQGIIVYDQVEAIVSDVYTKTSKENIEIISDLKGNTIKEIILNNAKVKDTNYTIEKSRVILKGDYLESLPAGEYKFTVRYNPMGEEFIENSTEGDKPEDITFTVKVQKAGLKAENFEYTEPKDLLYDEKAKVATVTAKPELEGIGKITVKYYDSKGNLLTGPPKDVGTYKVRIDVAPSDKYEAQTDIKSNSWNFEVEYLKVGENPYKITISKEDYTQDGSTYWLKDGNSAEISPTESIYKISKEVNGTHGTFSPSLNESSWTSGSSIYLQDEKGHITDKIPVNVNIAQDKTPPTGSITLNSENVWKELVKAITFGLFFKDDEQTLTIKAEDSESGIKEAKYLVLSNDNLIQGTTPEEIIKELEGKNGWVSFTGGSKDVTLKLKEYNKYVVYEKITDNVGHVTYVSSNGIVIYTDSEVEKSEIEYVKETEEDLKLKIFTKGNTIKDIEVKDKENVKRKVNCEVSEENANTNIITFPWGDLNKLEFGNYTVTITYNPQGVEYNGTGDAPTDLTVKLKVVKNPTVTIDKFDYEPSQDLTYDGKPKEAKVTVKEGVNGVGKITIKYYDSTGTLLEGPPTDVGEYTVKIDVTEGTSYGEVEGLTSENWIFKITQALPEDPVTPTLKAVKYGTKLSEITLDDGWNWVDDTIETTVENQGYMAYYDVEDYTNYDWSNIEGYNSELHRVERTLKLTVFVDKSDWGEEVKNNDEPNYVDKDGTTSAEVVKKDVTWVKEESDGTSAWYGVDNSEGEFELGSRFWVRWLSKDKDKEEWEYYYNNLDEKHKNAVDSGRLWIFLAGVTAPNGQEYEGFNKEVKFYIQLGEDWDKEDINAVFISSGEDEILDVSYVNDMSSPAGTQEFARLTLKHFSPYAVYDNLTDEERAALMESENKDEANSDNDNVMYRVWSLFTTGDTATPLLLTGLAVLVIASGATLIFLKKKRKK